MTSTDLTIIEAEIAEIENDMRRDLTGYFRDEGKQARYEGLLRTKQAHGSTPAPAANDDGLRANSVDEARAFFAETPAGRELMQAWGGNFAGNLQAAQAEAGAILAGMSPTEQQELMDMVDDLSPAAFAALMANLAKRRR